MENWVLEYSVNGSDIIKNHNQGRSEIGWSGLRSGEIDSIKLVLETRIGYTLPRLYLSRINARNLIRPLTNIPQPPNQSKAAKNAAPSELIEEPRKVQTERVVNGSDFTVLRTELGESGVDDTHV
jgi:hypothetical protein